MGMYLLYAFVVFFHSGLFFLSQVEEIEEMLRSLMVAGPLGNQLRMVKIELKANSFHNKRDYGIEEVQYWLNFVILNILTDGSDGVQQDFLNLID